MSTPKTLKKTYQQEQFTDSYQKCEEVAQETCYNRPGVAPKREQVPLSFVALWKPCEPDIMFMMIDGFPFICNPQLEPFLMVHLLFLTSWNLESTAVQGIGERASTEDEMFPAKFHIAHRPVR